MKQSDDTKIRQEAAVRLLRRILWAREEVTPEIIHTNQLPMLYFARISKRRYKAYYARDSKIYAITLTISAALGQFHEYIIAPNDSEYLSALVEQIRRAVFPEVPHLQYSELD